MELIPTMNLHTLWSFQPQSLVLFSAFGMFLVLYTYAAVLKSQESYPVPMFEEMTRNVVILIVKYETPLETRK